MAIETLHQGTRIAKQFVTAGAVPASTRLYQDPSLPPTPMNKLSVAALFCLLLPALPAPATDAGAAPAEDKSDIWSRTREDVNNWWERSQSDFGDWWQRSRESAGSAWEDTRSLFGQGDEDSFGHLWDRLLPKLGETLSLQERQAELPAHAWIGADKASNQAEINALLNEAVEILSTSGTRDYRARIHALQAAIAQANEEIADYRQRRVSAPEKSVVQKTVEDYNRAIEERTAAVRRDQKALADLKQAFAAELRKEGLELSDDQVDMLLATVVGDNLIDLGVVFDNVKAITQQLQHLVEESGEDLQSARRYYGMYVVLLKALRQMQLHIEQAITGTYIPQIDTISARAQALTAKTQALEKQSPDKKALLAANLEAQRLTIQAAGVYRQYLTEQAQQIAQARSVLEKDIAAAWNTYETVRVSGELVGLFKSSSQLLDGLLNRQVPPLRPFQNLEMKREFEKLTAQLRAAQGK